MVQCGVILLKGKVLCQNLGSQGIFHFSGKGGKMPRIWGGGGGGMFGKSKLVIEVSTF